MYGRLGRLLAMGAALAGGLLVGAGPAHAAEGTQTVTVTRPIGQVAFEEIGFDDAGRLVVTLVDTRANDPGWTVRVSVAGASLSPEVVEHTEPFTDGSGTTYAQQVSIGAPGTLASAPKGHGLGIARMRATVTPLRETTGAPVVTITLL